MDRYKICPSCHEKNAPTLLECTNCEADLTGVKITDEETENAVRAEKSEAPSGGTGELVRLCECGAKNPPNARKCAACGEDISDITPLPANAEKPNKTLFVLSSTDGQYAYKIKDESTEVGKERAMSEYLSAKPFVSRFHAVFTVENGRLYIENFSKTNFTYVNNKRIAAKTELFDGDEIGMGGTSINGKRQSDAAYFLVRIGSCT